MAPEDSSLGVSLTLRALSRSEDGAFLSLQWNMAIGSIPAECFLNPKPKLSEVLETGSIPGRFFLSAQACSGILRRAEKRGKALPQALGLALREVAAKDQTLNKLL
jgi:hypothetical protein